MRALKAGVLLISISFLTVVAAFSQAHPDWLERGQKAYEEKRYDDAVEA